MKVFRLSFGIIEKFIVAEDEQDARKQGQDPKLHPDLHFRPFDVQEVAVDGYDITAIPAGEAKPDAIEDTSEQAAEEIIEGAGETIDDMTREELKAWLDERGIEYVPQWGEKRLRELVIEHSKAAE